MDPAAAHTEVLRSSPAPAEVVGGTVDEVELTFLDPVLPGAEIVVLDDLGQPVEGLAATELSEDGTVARVGFAPLETAGGYVVDYAFTAEDGDRQRQTYRFTYQPADRRTTAEDSRDPMRPASAGVFAAVLVAVGIVAVRRRA